MAHPGAVGVIALDEQMRGLVVHQLLSAIYTGFNAEGLEIPYSQPDVYIKQMPDRPLDG